MEKQLALIEPYLGLSHKEWLWGIKRYVCPEADLYSLPPRFWKWRMHGAAFTLAEKVLSSSHAYRTFLCSSFLELSVFKPLIAHPSAQFIYYFHENQFCYPGRQFQEGDHSYGMIQLKSALLADSVYFNSCYHKQEFFSAAKYLMEQMPDFKIRHLLSALEEKARVLPLAMDLKAFGDLKLVPHEPPIVLWNHRWEHDKNPECFFKALQVMKEKGVSFKLNVLGESFSKSPELFSWARDYFKEEILNWGFVPSKDEYRRLVLSSDIAFITSFQENFGISSLESAYCGLQLIAPRRLVYPETLGSWARYYDSDEEGVRLLEEALRGPSKSDEQKKKQRCFFSRFDWLSQQALYQEAFLR